MPGGGAGRGALVIWNIWPTKPSGVQLPVAIRPPGRQTRFSSEGDNLGARSEHALEHGAPRRTVPLGRSPFGVAFDEFNFRCSIPQRFAGLLQEIGSDVEIR